jgi:ATP-binding cassette, subfamily B, bacterial PglK
MKKSDQTFKEIVLFSRVLSRSDRRKLTLVTGVNSMLSVLDLIGVTLIGIIGALTVSGVSSRQPEGKVGEFLSFIGISEVKFQNQVALLATAAASLLITRTLLSIVITRRTLFFLSRRNAELSSKLITQVMAQPLSTLRNFTSQHIQYTLTTGTSALTIGVFGSLVAVAADGALLLVLGIGVTIIDPLTAAATVIIFGTILVVMYFLTNSKYKRMSKYHSENTILDSEILLELVNGYREAFIRNRRGYFVDRAKKVKWELADYSAEIAWLPNISKYVVEIAFTFGAMAVAALQFFANDSAQAVGSLALFLAAGTRITPALLRIQQNLVAINGNVIKAKPTIELLAETDSEFTLPEYSSEVDFTHEGFVPKIEIRNLSFNYSGSELNVLKDINLQIKPGESIAIVGPSGSGKSTLVDLILGMYIPSSGSISISGHSPADSIVKWPGAIGYVPQEVVLMSGDISSNITSGFDYSEISMKLTLEALKVSSLESFVDSLPKGLLTKIGERGTKLSGGQKQRVGIARAMFTKPQLLVFDEATSALDGQTEFEISEAIQALKGKVTLILIAHRLSTVKKADKIIYLEAGKVTAEGSFEEVRKLVPDFDRQAHLMGL